MATLGSGTVSIPGSVSSSMLSVIHTVEPGAAVAVWRMREDPAPADDHAAKPRGLAEIRRTFAELGDPAWDRYPRWNLRPACFIGGLAGLVPLRSRHAQQGRLELAVGGRWHVYDGGEQQNGLIGGTRQLQAGVNARL